MAKNKVSVVYDKQGKSIELNVSTAYTLPTDTNKQFTIMLDKEYSLLLINDTTAYQTLHIIDPPIDRIVGIKSTRGNGTLHYYITNRDNSFARSVTSRNIHDVTDRLIDLILRVGDSVKDPRHTEVLQHVENSVIKMPSGRLRSIPLGIFLANADKELLNTMHTIHNTSLLNAHDVFNTLDVLTTRKLQGSTTVKIDYAQASGVTWISKPIPLEIHGHVCGHSEFMLESYRSKLASLKTVYVLDRGNPLVYKTTGKAAAATIVIDELQKYYRTAGLCVQLPAPDSVDLAISKDDYDKVIGINIVIDRLVTYKDEIGYLVLDTKLLTV